MKITLKLIGVLALTFALDIDAIADQRILSGETEHGIKYTEIYVAPDDPEAVRDDEDYDRYQYSNHWLQYEHPLSPVMTVSVRGQQSEREFVDRPLLDNSTRHAKVRLSIEPDRHWAIWPQVSARLRDYERNTLDNEILSASVEARYRWGIRDNVRFGASWNGVSYENEPARDRDQVAVFASVEKPVTESLTVRVRGRLERSDFATVAASRENATRGSAAVGFRYEF